MQFTVRSGPSGPVEMGQEANQGGAGLLCEPLFLPSGLWASPEPLFLPFWPLPPPSPWVCFRILLSCCQAAYRAPEKQAAGLAPLAERGQARISGSAPWPTLQGLSASAFNLGTLSHLRTSPPFCCHQSPFTMYSDFRRDRKYPPGS